MNGGWETGPSKIFSIYLKPEAYIKTQLQRERRPSQCISQQMRNVARSLTPAEIDEAARYYASQPPNVQSP
jgi:cytochrome c553